MGHGTNDKLFITPSEYSGVYGQHGATRGAARTTSVIVPFHMCAITHQPWTTPACLRQDALVCDKAALVAFIEQYGKSPASGEPASLADVLELHIARNERGEWHDPVSMREFTDHSHLVALPSGYVYLHETVQQLNIKPKMMRDLITDAPFQKSDILTLQDPHAPEKRDMQGMFHVQHNLTLKQQSTGDDVNAAATGSTRALIEQLRQKREREKEPEQDVPAEAPARTTGKSTGRAAASFTSSSLTPHTRTEELAVDEEQVMFETLSSKHTKNALVRLQTNFGSLVIELFVNKAPRTCYNFVMLCRRGAYNDTTFHRNIPGFMIQGGDPSGTGRGGQSIWGKPFDDELCNANAARHTHRGVVSMANKGPNTNGSQFFVTYRATPHLDAKHTVFGQLVSERSDGAFPTLDAMERVPNVSDTTQPIRPIKLIEAQVFDDPFEEYAARRDAKARRERPDDEERARRELKRKKRDEDRTTWYVATLTNTHRLGTKLAPKDGTSNDARHVPSMLAVAGDEHGLAGLARPRAPAAPRRKVGGFGDFGSW